MDFDTAWNALGVAGQRALELAWQSFISGDKGIGAVLADDNGTLMADGRNRSISGSPVAQAEIEALGKLRPGSYQSWTLTTTLQPCPMCASAIALSGVGKVHNMAPDPTAVGVDRLPDFIGSLAADWPEMSGPEKTAIDEFCQLLSAYHPVRNKPRGTLAKLYGASHPALVTFASNRWQPDMSDSVRDAAFAIWDELTLIRTHG